MLTNGVEQKGKAVEIHHHLFDALWNIGSRQIDAAVLVPQEPTDEEEQKQVEECLPITDAPSDTPKVEESKQETDEVQNDQKKINDDEVEKQQISTAIEESKDEEDVPVEEMDARILEAFYRSLLESV